MICINIYIFIFIYIYIVSKMYCHTTPTTWMLEKKTEPKTPLNPTSKGSLQVGYARPQGLGFFPDILWVEKYVVLK